MLFLRFTPDRMAEVMEDTEQLICAVMGGTVRRGDRAIDVHAPFERITVCEAFARYARRGA